MMDIATTTRQVVRIVGAMTFVLTATTARSEDADSQAVDFARDIRPILSDTCYQCHGPDANQRQAELRLDQKEDVFAERDSRRIVTPSQPSESELFRRVSATDPDERMPPADADRKLSAAQIELIRRWIEQGANWQQHWSFTPPARSIPPRPASADQDWIRNPVDRFVLARMIQAGLSPSPTANRETLIRRVTLDLTGLPPTPREVDAFLSDPSPDAYEKVVDRLLASPRFGERMAVDWLDAARYADTNGYQNDGPREMWRWRDWVIDAYNQNMPFDQFTVEQLAGDLLPNPTLEQQIATGFNRNHRGNAEGGVIPEEYAVEYVVDRVETTATVWMGLTLGCARCHDHKYDPFSQKEFYGLFAYFNNVPEHGRAIKEGNSPPYIPAPTQAQRAELAELNQQLATAEEKFNSLQPRIAKAQTEWELSLNSAAEIDWIPSQRLLAHFPLDDSPTARRGRSPEAEFENDSPQFATGRYGNSVVFDGAQSINAGDVANFGYFDEFTISTWIQPGELDGSIISRMANTARAEGYQIALRDGRVEVNLVKRWLDDAIRVETKTTVTPQKWVHLAVTYDGSRVADGVKIYLDGEPQAIQVNLDFINQSFATDAPFRIAAGGADDDRFVGRIDDVRIYQSALPAQDVQILSVPETISEIVRQSLNERTAPQSAKLRAYYLRYRSEGEIESAYKELVSLRRKRVVLTDSFANVMVMHELPTPRETFVLKRGRYDQPTEPVEPGLPSALAIPGGEYPANRLGLAQWLIDERHPLTARVAVNRYWQMFFGRGLVETSFDFGSQGTPPSHPELLDWLAVEFRGGGDSRAWDVKRLIRLIVTSATYRQSSYVTPEKLAGDPNNRWLSRGPRFRLSAEVIRDQALFASELLIERIGGPSVKPYQPPGLWQEVSGQKYQPGRGEDLYRRSLYTFWKRTVAPPAMMTFDAAARETCQVIRPRTNTPLQALVLMNDVTYVEAARSLATRVFMETNRGLSLREAPPPPNREAPPPPGRAAPRGLADARLTLMFRIVTARQPNERELEILRGGLSFHRARFEANSEAASELIAVGESPVDSRLDVSELAAYTVVAQMLLNLDEAITKE